MIPVSTRAPSTAHVVELMRKELLGSKVQPNQFLPSERVLSKQFQVARVTVRRALKSLVGEGLIRAEPGRGYRALMRVAGMKPGSPVAVVAGQTPVSFTAEASFDSLQSEISASGWQTLTVVAGTRAPDEIVRALADAGVWGAALEACEPATARAIHESGLPCLSLARLNRELPIDSVLIDNFDGARRAAEYLLDKGHRRVAWFGPVTESDHSIERYQGAQAAFLDRRLELPQEYVVDVQTKDEAQIAEAAQALLARADRPTAVIAAWPGLTLSVGLAARRAGLALGKDVELVGWGSEVTYRARILPAFDGGPLPVVALWSKRAMVRTALQRLMDRVKDPHLPPVRISIPMRLIHSPKDLEDRNHGTHEPA